MTPGCEAAVEVGLEHGFSTVDPVVLQETNNTVVWLRPHDVIAKVGTRADSLESLVRELGVARALAAIGAQVGEPVAGASPTRHRATGYVVTLWRRLDHDASKPPSPSAVGDSLRRLHDDLSRCELRLPDFRVGIRQARLALRDESRGLALAPADRVFLGEVTDELLPTLETRAFQSRPLHGEPHSGNCVQTTCGVRWIDFEGACTGPLEWDLAFVPEGARASFPNIDRELLAVLCALNSARVATWCWIQARFPDMRWHAQHHLDLLRESWPM